MLTTNPFSIRTYRGMGELDPPGTYRDWGVEGESESHPRGRLRSGAPASPSGESGLALLLRCPKFFARYSLAEFRPLPLARLPSSAPGGGRLAPPSDFSFSAGFLF